MTDIVCDTEGTAERNEDKAETEIVKETRWWPLIS